MVGEDARALRRGCARGVTLVGLCVCVANDDDDDDDERATDEWVHRTRQHRCGKRSYHIQKSTCAACGYPSARTRSCTCLSMRTAPLVAIAAPRGTRVARVFVARAGVDDVHDGRDD